jgi:phage repressor protein C with HTH and peptisase S24 domain
MLKDRLDRALREKPGATQAGLAKACGVRAPSVHGWLSGTTKTLKGSSLLAAASYLGVNPLWLESGKGSMRPDDSNSMSTGIPTELSTAESLDEIPTGYVRFPLLEGFVSAGEGGYVSEYPEVVRNIDVAEEWARRNLSAPPARVRVITAQGDSMQPEIHSGDVLFVDAGITWFDADAVYVMNWQGRPIVKRLQALRDGSLLIKSSNPAYAPETVPAEEADQLFITGRVVGIWKFAKY